MHDIAEFLGGRDPFSGLDEQALEDLAARTEVEFFPAGTTIIPQGRLSQGRIRVVRRGSVELVDRGTVIDLLGEGEMFGHPSVLSGLPAKQEARAREDTLGYSLPAEDVIPLLGRPSSLRFLTRSLLSRADRAPGDEIVPPSPEVAQQPAAALVRRPAVSCGPETACRDAARLMNAEEVSSVLVEIGNGDFGILTDRDLRAGVVAGPLSRRPGLRGDDLAGDRSRRRSDGGRRHAGHARQRHQARAGLLGTVGGARCDRRDRSRRRRDEIAIRPAADDRRRHEPAGAERGREPPGARP